MGEKKNRDKSTWINHRAAPNGEKFSRKRGEIKKKKERLEKRFGNQETLKATKQGLGKWGDDWGEHREKVC